MLAMSKANGKRPKIVKALPAKPVSQKQRRNSRKDNPNSMANLKPFVPGVSGNPGGVKKGTVFVSEAYKRIISLPPEDFATFEPSSVAEQIALGMVKRARGEYAFVEPLNYAREITDRTEGKAPMNVNLSNVQADDQARMEAVIDYVRKHGKCSREVAIEALEPRMPEIAQLITQLGKIG